MPEWLSYSLISVALWGVVGLLQKLGANRISAPSLTVWLTAGFILMLPVLLWNTRLGALSAGAIGFGVVIGIANGVGSWCLFAALEKGAKASIAIPLTALYPLVTALLSVILLGERLSPRQWTGLALAIAAGIMLSYEREAEKPAESRKSCVIEN
jgi:transporter family protein